MRRNPILLVEDNADDEMLSLRALRNANITNEILVARDGVEALDQIFGTGTFKDRGPLNPAVVLLDLKLPLVSGLEVLERIRQTKHTRKLPVVILTSSSEEEDVARSYELNANSYVRKPVEFGEFTKVVSQLGLYWALLNEPPPADK